MKKFLGTAALAATLLIGGSALAASSTIDVNLGLAQVTQSSNDTVRQVALSGAVALGKVDDQSSLTSTAINGLNLSDVSENISDLAGGTYEGQGAIADVDQTIKGATHQTSLSVALADGPVTGASSLSSTAANLANQSSISLHVH